MKKINLTIYLSIMWICGFSQDLSNRIITNYEYRQFVEYVRDSICYNIVQRDNLSPYSQFSFKEFRNQINWDYLQKSQNLFPELFYPVKEVKNEWDLRKFIYSKDSVNIYPNIYTWIDTNRCSQTDDFLDNDNYDRYSYDGVEVNLSKYYFTHPLFNDFPVQGLTSEQINAFENWKNERGELDFSKNICQDSVIKFDVDTSFWNITYSEYSVLIKNVIDSIIKLHLYYEYSDSTMKIDYTSPEQREIIELMGIDNSVNPIIYEIGYWNYCEFAKKYSRITNKDKMSELVFSYFDLDRIDVLPSSNSKFANELLNGVDQIPNFYENCQLEKWTNKSLNKELTYPQAFAYFYFTFLNNNNGNFNTITELIGQTPILFRRDWEKWVNDKSNLKTERTITIPEKFYHKNE